MDADLWDGNQFSSYLNQALLTSSSPQFVNVYASEWLRNNHSSEGLYNQANDAHFYSAGGSYWHMNGDSGNMTAGGLILYSQYNSSQGHATNRKGYLYWDSSGFGLLSNDGSWAYRHNNTNADIYGTIRQDGTNTVWHAGNDGSGSGLDADTLDGLQLHTGTNNEVNKVVRTNSSGYLMTGWINTTSGSRPRTTAPSRIYASDDGYIRYYSLSDFKVALGLPNSTFNRSISYSNTSGYHTGVMGYSNAYNANTTLCHLGSGFIDFWNSTSNAPDTGHWVGMQSFHAVNWQGTADQNYGWQIVNKGGSTGNLKMQAHWGNTNYGWQTIWNSANDGSGSGLDADTLDGQQGSYYSDYNNLSNKPTIPTNNNQLTNGAGYITNGANYNVNDDWFRENGDNAHVKIYGNSRQMIFRTDGETEFSSGIGAYAFVWLYGGNAAGNRRMLLDHTGDLWTSNNGWLSSALSGKAASSHSHSYAATSHTHSYQAAANELSWVDQATGNYGTIKVDDDRSVTWAGYAIRDDWVLMSSGADTAGIYNDTDNEWSVIYRRNAEVELHYNGTVEAETASGYFLANNQCRSPIFYDNNNTSYYSNPAGDSVFNGLFVDSKIYFKDGVSTNDARGIYFDGGSSKSYAIYRESGSWSHPYPDLVIGFHTGIKIGGHKNYNGTRFYNREPNGSEALVMEVANNNDNVRVVNTLTASGDSRAPIFYDSNDTGYKLDPNSTGDSALRIRGGALHGPNVTWGDYLLVGGDGRQNYTNNTTTASVCTTDGNLHLDAASGHNLYLNYYDGNNVYFGNGGNGNVAQVANNGTFRSPVFYDYNNTAYYLDANTTGTSLNVAGAIVAGGNVTAYSDIKFKEDIKVIPDAVEKVKAMRGVTYTRNDLEDREVRHTGVIAQEVEQVLPEAVREGINGKTVAYGNMVGLLIEAIKEQQKQIDELKAKLL